MSPGEALQWGLVNRVVPAGQVLSSAMELAVAVAENAPLAVRTSKKIIKHAAAEGSAWDGDIWALQQEQLVLILATADAREGAMAFAEKRPATWTGS